MSFTVDYKIIRKKGTLIFKGSIRGDIYSLICGCPGHFKFKDGLAYVRVTEANLLHLNGIDESVMTPDALELFEEFHARQKENRQLVKEKTYAMELQGVACEDYEYHRVPRDHQHRCFMMSRDRKSFAVLAGQGTGKTKITLDTAQYLFEQDKIDALLIVAWPCGVHINWTDWELEEDLKPSIPCRSYAWTSKTTKAEKELIEYTLEQTSDRIFRVLAFNVEASRSDKARDVILRTLNEFRCLLVIDQSASIKNPSAKCTKFLIDECSQLAEYKRILDGSPVAEGPDEAYSQFKFLDENIIGHDTWTAFKNEFCQIGRFNNVIGFKNLDEFKRRIAPHCFRITADECQDIPERIYHRHYFELSKKEREVFDGLKEKACASFDGEKIRLEGPLAKYLRLQQASSGIWPAEDSQRYIEDPPSRLKAFMDLIKTLEGKTIIYTRFKSDADLIEKCLKDLNKSFGRYDGSVSGDEKEEAKRRFQKGDDEFIIGQIQTLSIGHTLTAATNIIFYTNHPSLRFREEAEKRAHRDGQTKHVQVWDLIAIKTTDEKTIKAFQAKKNLSEMILDLGDAFYDEM